MSNSCGPGGTDEYLVCPTGHSPAQSVPLVTLYHILKPTQARAVDPDKSYGVCRERSCSVVYFSSDHTQTWESSHVRPTIGFKKPEDEPPHLVCYCFGYTEENITDEILETGESTVVEWITERVQAEECACEYKNPTGRCCLGDVRAVVRATAR